MRNSSAQSANGPLPAKHLNPRLDKMIAAYTSVASATIGAALLASPQTVDAEIVYTKTNVTITHNGPGYYQLDLNNDGITDFEIDFCSCVPHGTELWVQVVDSYVNAPRNAVRQQAAFPGDAAPLVRGAEIGSKQAFVTPPQYSGASMAIAGCYGGPYSGGPWLNVKNRYLGLKFLIHGQVHYGWARVSVTATEQVLTAVLTGYAYETVANKSLRAGQTSEITDGEAQNSALLTSPVKHALSLGMLALGAEAIEVWRRKERVV